MKNSIKIILLFVSILFIGCKKSVQKTTEKYRSKFHFTPPANWMNDPNGLVYNNGKYHLFYQYYPNATVWGPMHWGHATSTDLLKWEHQPVALYPDSLGYIFSGSAVVDSKNSAGFGKDAMIAIFTYHEPNGEKTGAIDFQTQGIAYSTDDGQTWTKYKDNPVIKNPGIKDFRDPKVFWNAQKLMWQLVLVAKDHVQIYDSKNLKNWTKISEFRFNDQPALGVWECPDLFPLKVGNSEDEKWVLIISHGGDSAPNGGSGTRYFVGDYDGTTFTTQQKESQWLDYGTDNYAGVTYNNTPNNKRIFIGWMSNWNYAVTTPTKKWRSAMTLPRELELIKKGEKYLLKNKLIDGFKNTTSTISKNEISGNFLTKLTYKNLQESVISFDVLVKNKVSFSLSNKLGDLVQLNYDKVSGMFSINREKSGNVNFNEKYKKTGHQTMKIGSHENLTIQLVLDAASIEIFINDGEYVMTNQIFPRKNLTDFSFEKSDATITNFAIKKVDSLF